MENFETIDQYIAAHLGNKIERRAKSPLLGLVLIILGAVLTVIAYATNLTDNLQTLVLTIGVISLIVGLVLAVLSFTKVLWVYRHKPTGSTLRDCKLYLTASDYRLCLDAIIDGHPDALPQLNPVTSSNAALRLVGSPTAQLLLVQAGNYDSGPFSPTSPVAMLEGAATNALMPLLK